MNRGGKPRPCGWPLLGLGSCGAPDWGRTVFNEWRVPWIKVHLVLLRGGVAAAGLVPVDE